MCSFLYNLVYRRCFSNTSSRELTAMSELFELNIFTVYITRLVFKCVVLSLVFMYNRKKLEFGMHPQSISQIRSSYGHKTIHFLGSLLWNALPPDLKELSNTKMFKQKLKIYLLSHWYWVFCFSGMVLYICTCWLFFYISVSFFVVIWNGDKFILCV